MRFVEDTTTRGYIGSGDWAVNGLAQADFGISSVGVLAFATTGGAEQMRINSSGDIAIAKSARITQVAITSSSNAVAWNAKTAANAYHVTTQNTTFSAPSNAVEGAIISVEIAQGGTARTIAVSYTHLTLPTTD